MSEDTITKTVTDAAITNVKAVEAVAAKAVAVAAPAKAKRAYTKRKLKAAPVRVVAAAKKIKQRAATASRRKSTPVAAAAAPLFEGTPTMTNDFTSMFAQFQIPGADKFTSMFGDAGTRGTEFATKGQKAVAELGEFAKSNLEAFAEAGRIAAAGVRSISEDALNSNRQGLELVSTNAKSLASATSPTEFLQLQAELARASFDRMVANGSKMTEQVVKLAGEAIQPISTRASINAERINELMA